MNDCLRNHTVLRPFAPMPLPSPEPSSTSPIDASSAEPAKPLSRAELVDALEDLADRLRDDNLYARLVLTALAAAVHVGEERDLGRYVADFERQHGTLAHQERLLNEALAILGCNR